MKVVFKLTLLAVTVLLLFTLVGFAQAQIQQLQQGLGIASAAASGNPLQIAQQALGLLGGGFGAGNPACGGGGLQGLLGSIGNIFPGGKALGFPLDKLPTKALTDASKSVTDTAGTAATTYEQVEAALKKSKAELKKTSAECTKLGKESFEAVKNKAIPKPDITCGGAKGIQELDKLGKTLNDGIEKGCVAELKTQDGKLTAQEAKLKAARPLCPVTGVPPTPAPCQKALKAIMAELKTSSEATKKAVDTTIKETVGKFDTDAKGLTDNLGKMAKGTDPSQYAKYLTPTPGECNSCAGAAHQAGTALGTITQLSQICKGNLNNCLLQGTITDALIKGGNCPCCAAGAVTQLASSLTGRAVFDIPITGMAAYPLITGAQGVDPQQCIALANQLLQIAGAGGGGGGAGGGGAGGGGSGLGEISQALGLVQQFMGLIPKDEPEPPESPRQSSALPPPIPDTPQLPINPLPGEDLTQRPRNKDDHAEQKQAETLSDMLAAQNNIKTAQENAASQKNAPGTIKDTIIRDNTGASQDLRQLDGKNDDAFLGAKTIYVVNKKDFMFGMEGIGNTGTTDYGVALSVPAWGLTQIEVARVGGASIITPQNKLVSLAPGSYMYTGSGTMKKDTYTAHGGMLDWNSRTHVRSTADCGTGNKITGNVVWPKIPTVEVTFDHFRLGPGTNAVDISTRAAGTKQQILGSGCADLLFLHGGIAFPWHLRTTAKGSSHIVYFQGIILDQEYAIEDTNGYVYTLRNTGGTKVYASTGKVIQDTVPPPPITRTRERQLIYVNL